MSRVEAFELTLLKFIHASANFFHSTAPALNSLLSRITVKLQCYSLKFSAEIIKLPFCSLVCCHVVAKASRNEMRGASVPYVYATLIQRIYSFTREKIPSFVDELAQLFVNTVKVFLTNLRKWKVFFHWLWYQCIYPSLWCGANCFLWHSTSIRTWIVRCVIVHLM